MQEATTDNTGSRKVISNTFYLFLDWISITSLGYLFWVALAKLLVPSDLGFFSTIFNTAIMISAFTTMGFGPVITKLISKYTAIKNDKKSNGVMRHTFKLSMIMNLLASVILVASVLFFDGLGEFNIYVAVGVVLYLFSHSIYSLSGYFLVGYQNMKLIFKTNFTAYVLKLILAVVLVYAGFSYFGPLAAFVMSSFLAVMIRLPHLHINAESITDKKEVMFYSIPSILITIGLTLIAQSNVVILGIMDSMTSVGMFTIAFLFATLIKSVPQTITISIQPTISQQWELKETTRIKKLIEQSVRYSLLIVMPAVALFIMLPMEIIQMFSTADYLPVVLPVQILMVSSIILGIAIVFSSVLYGIGHVKKNGRIVLASGIINVLLCFALIPMYGMNGAALASLISSIILFAAMTHYLSGKVDLSFNFKSLAKILTASIILAAVIFLIQGSVASYSQRIIISVAAGFIVYILSLYLMNFFEETDVKMIRYAERRFPKKLLPILNFLSKKIEHRIHK